MKASLRFKVWLDQMKDVRIVWELHLWNLRSINYMKKCSEMIDRNARFSRRMYHRDSVSELRAVVLPIDVF